MTLLDVSWNRLHHPHMLTSHLKDARCELVSLNLSYNAFGAKQASGLLALGYSLRSNTALARLDVRYNRIGPEASTMFINAMMVNTSLTQLQLSGNPIGYHGGQAVLRAQAMLNGQQRQIAIEHCSFEDSGLKVTFLFQICTSCIGCSDDNLQLIA